MKFTLTTKEFKAIVKDLSKANLKQRDYIKFEVEDSQVHMTVGFEPLIRKTTSIATDLVDGVVTTEFGNLKKLSTKLKGQFITFELKNNLEITCDNIKLNLEKVDNTLNTFVAGQSVEVDTKEFIERLKEVAHSASKQVSRPILQAVHMEIENGQLKMVTTDSYRLSQSFTALLNSKGNDKKEFIINPSAIELKKLYNLSLGEKLTISLSEDSGFVMIDDNENTQVVIENIEARYPETDRLIPKSGSTFLNVKVSDMLEAIETAEIIAKQAKHNFVSLDMLNGNATLIAENASMQTEIGLGEYKEDELKIAFNPTYAKEALKTYDKDDIVEITFVSSIRPFFFKVNDNLQLLTPIRRAS